MDSNGYVTVNDLTMYYEVHGAGEPLVLIMGLAADISEYGTLIEPLAARYRVIAFDNRGAGRTDKPDAAYSIEMMAGDTAGLMDALGIAEATILGLSMGGRIALALTLQHPQKVKNLVLVSTGARVVTSWRRVFLGLASQYLFRGKYPQPRYAFKRQRQASQSYNCTDHLHQIQVPTVIMHGKKDTVAPYAVAEEMHRRIKDSRIIAFSGGHLFFLMGERQRFLETVMEFL